MKCSCHQKDRFQRHGNGPRVADLPRRESGFFHLALRKEVLQIESVHFELFGVVYLRSWRGVASGLETGLFTTRSMSSKSSRGTSSSSKVGWVWRYPLPKVSQVCIRERGHRVGCGLLDFHSRCVADSRVDGPCGVLSQFDSKHSFSYALMRACKLPGLCGLWAAHWEVEKI